jgi:hypothetical protein
MDNLAMLEGSVSGIEFGWIFITYGPMSFLEESDVKCFGLESDSCFDTDRCCVND